MNEKLGANLRSIITIHPYPLIHIYRMIFIPYGERLIYLLLTTYYLLLTTYYLLLTTYYLLLTTYYLLLTTYYLLLMIYNTPSLQ
ncbi:hypothetical protein BK121_12895 [Paenibacillus odorifer]|nr:hypothetical protein BK121_12895 [Paenibacillus odorifer]